MTTSLDNLPVLVLFWRGEQPYFGRQMEPFRKPRRIIQRQSSRDRLQDRCTLSHLKAPARQNIVSRNRWSKESAWNTGLTDQNR